MKKTRLLVLICTVLLFCGQAAAQKYISVYANDNNDGTYDLYADVAKTGTFTVIIQFTRLQNLTGSGIEAIRSSGSASMGQEYKTSIIGSGRIMTLRPIDPTSPSYYSYNYSYIRGKLNPKVNRDFVYRLPVADGRKTTTVILPKRDSEENSETQNKTILFQMEAGDTVYAVRKGYVVDMENSILVEHDDGSLAQYSDIPEESYFVKEGSMVYPDTPLGLAARVGHDNYLVRLSIYYLFNDKDFLGADILGPFKYHYIDPIFSTKEGNVMVEYGKTYTSVVTEEIITKEMSKREVKRRTKK